jgi:predicted transcriptional regulator
MTKSTVLQSLDELPDEFPVEQFIERLLFVQNVEEGLRQSEQGQTVPLDEVKQRFHR